MNLNSIFNKITDELELKIQNDKLSRDDLEDAFNSILQASKILFYFDNNKIDFIKNKKINLYLFFVAFIKNYLNEISKYIESLDLSGSYTSEINKEINHDNNNLLRFLNKSHHDKSEVIPLNNKNNDEIFETVNKYLEIIAGNQKSESEAQLIDKLTENKKLLSNHEEVIKNYINEIIDTRNKYLKYKALLESRFQNDLNIIEFSDTLKNNLNNNINVIEQNLKDMEENIKSYIVINQKLHDEINTNVYPHF